MPREMKTAPGELSYGGLKNCSKTTYIPLIISVKRKYLPALSKELSLASSQRSLRGSLNPAGGGPRGVAYRNAVMEKAAAAVDDDTLDNRIQPPGEVSGLELHIVVSGRSNAISSCNTEWRCEVHNSKRLTPLVRPQSSSAIGY